MLQVEGLHVNYGKVAAVRNVSFELGQGRVLLMLGANGAGKSTTLKAISGLHPPISGRVSLDGDDVTGTPVHKLVRRGVTLVPEGRRMFASLTVQENLRMGGYIRSRSEYAAKLDEVLEMFPILRERRNGPAGLLSGGEQQMLAFGRALMSTPSYVLMDEPSMGLAPALVEQVLASVRTIADTGVGVLIVEQNADIGLELADDVIVLSRGEVVFEETDSVARSHTAILRAFLGEDALVGDV